MPVISIKAKKSDTRPPEKIDALMQEIRAVTAKHLEIPQAKVLVVYEELAAGIFWDGESVRPGAPKK